MFVKRLVLVISLFAFIAMGVGYSLSHVSEKDRAMYQSLMNRKLESSKSLSSQQRRSNVHKSFLITKGNKRLKTSMKSKSSEIVLNREMLESGVVERCQKMVCYTQDLLTDSPATQSISYLEADSASYFYDKQELLADQVTLANYQIDGHELVNPIEKNSVPLIQGEAASIDLSINEDPHFTLLGHVEVQHPLGRLTANRMNFIQSDEKQVLNLEIEGDVKFYLKDGGVLHCHRANLDYQALKAVFLGDEGQSDVLYEDNYKTKRGSGKTTPITIRSKKMELNLQSLALKDQRKSKPVLSEIRACGDIRVNTGDGYTVYADSASYQHVPKKQLFLYSSQNGSKDCRVIQPNGDRIKSKEIVLDLQENKILCADSQGVIDDQVEFSSEKLTWDDTTHTLVLHKNVKIIQKGIGELVTDDEVRIVEEISEEKKQIRLIECPQNTFLSYTDEKKKLIHTLKCHGPLTLDHAAGKVKMESPVNTSGDVSKNLQIHFEDFMGDIYADQAELTYKKGEQGAVFTELHMEGHVRVFNRFDANLPESSSVLQYALADVVDYFPQKKEILLSGLNRNRVLFMDRVNSLEMSAPSLVIQHNDRENKNMVQGMGDVRFTLIERELEQLRRYFRFNEKELNGKK